MSQQKQPIYRSVIAGLVSAAAIVHEAADFVAQAAGVVGRSAVTTGKGVQVLGRLVAANYDSPDMRQANSDLTKMLFSTSRGMRTGDNSIANTIFDVVALSADADQDLDDFYARYEQDFEEAKEAKKLLKNLQVAGERHQGAVAERIEMAEIAQAVQRELATRNIDARHINVDAAKDFLNEVAHHLERTKGLLVEGNHPRHADALLMIDGLLDDVNASTHAVKARGGIINLVLLSPMATKEEKLDLFVRFAEQVVASHHFAHAVGNRVAEVLDSRDNRVQEELQGLGADGRREMLLNAPVDADDVVAVLNRPLPEAVVVDPPEVSIGNIAEQEHVAEHVEQPSVDNADTPVPSVASSASHVVVSAPPSDVDLVAPENMGEVQTPVSSVPVSTLPTSAAPADDMLETPLANTAGEVVGKEDESPAGETPPTPAFLSDSDGDGGDSDRGGVSELARSESGAPVETSKNNAPLAGAEEGESRTDVEANERVDLKENNALKTATASARREMVTAPAEKPNASSTTESEAAVGSPIRAGKPAGWTPTLRDTENLQADLRKRLGVRDEEAGIDAQPAAAASSSLARKVIFGPQTTQDGPDSDQAKSEPRSGTSDQTEDPSKTDDGELSVSRMLGSRVDSFTRDDKSVGEDATSSSQAGEASKSAQQVEAKDAKDEAVIQAVARQNKSAAEASADIAAQTEASSEALADINTSVQVREPVVSVASAAAEFHSSEKGSDGASLEAGAVRTTMATLVLPPVRSTGSDSSRKEASAIPASFEVETEVSKRLAAVSAGEQFIARTLGGGISAKGSATDLTVNQEVKEAKHVYHTAVAAEWASPRSSVLSGMKALADRVDKVDANPARKNEHKSSNAEDIVVAHDLIQHWRDAAVETAEFNEAAAQQLLGLANALEALLQRNPKVAEAKARNYVKTVQQHLNEANKRSPRGSASAPNNAPVSPAPTARRHRSLVAA